MASLEEPQAWKGLGQLSWVLLRVGIVTYALWLVGAGFLQRKVIFPVAATRAPSVDLLERLGGERSWLETEAGPVETWFFPAPGASAEEPAPLVLYAHGNAELIQGQVPAVELYRELGAHLLLCEYRGYGESAGSPSQAGLVADQRAALERVLLREDVDAERVLYHGRSLGTGVVCALARERAPRALVLFSPFTSVRTFVTSYAVPGFLVWDPFDNAAALAEVGAPTRIVHGDGDGVIPVEHARELAQLRAGIQLVELSGVGHNDLEMGATSEVVGAFLSELEFAGQGQR